MRGDRVSTTGDLAASALEFDGTPLSFDETTVVTARAFDGSNWSAPVQSIFSSAQPGDVRITEVMYHPRGPINEKETEFDGEDFEFVELTNTGDVPAWLAGYWLVGGVECTLASESGKWLFPGESGVAGP